MENSLNLKKRAISGKNHGISKLPKALNCAPLLYCSYTCTFNVCILVIVLLHVHIFDIHHVNVLSTMHGI